MRTLTVTLLLVALATAAVVPQKKEDDPVKLQRQYDILKLFVRVHQNTLYKDQAEIAKTYKLDGANYKYPELVKEYTCRDVANGFLPRGEPFSIYLENQLEEVKLIVDLLYFAKDFDTFYKTAVYVRERINEAEFVYSVYVAVLLREDTQYIVLPPPYEVYPELFITSDIIQKAYEARLSGLGTSEDKPYVIYANYTGYPEARTREGLVSYFTEDVGLNAFYAFLNYRYPFFLDATNYSIPNGQRRGEIFYFSRQQLLARFNLERLSFNLPEVQPLSYFLPVKTGYYPEIRLQNGVEVPVRPEGISLVDTDIKSVELLQKFESRLKEAVDLGLVIYEKEGRKPLKEGEAINILGNLLESSVDTVYGRFYGSLYRTFLNVFGNIADPTNKYHVVPGVLEHVETSLRDPLYFQIVERILNIIRSYQNYLHPYTVEELTFPGVKVESLTTDKLVTFFDLFDFSLGNAVDVPRLEEIFKVNVVARLPRLSHKPFQLRATVRSDVASKALVRFFLGPHYDALGRELRLDAARQDFVELDRFYYDLVQGENVIKRDSREFYPTSGEAPSFRTLYRRVQTALQGKEPFSYDEFRGFPDSLLLPRGSRDGLALRLYVIVTPAAADVASVSPRDAYPFRTTDGRALGFPFDRRIPCDYLFRGVPNTRFEDVVVYHKTVDEVNRPAP